MIELNVVPNTPQQNGVLERALKAMKKRAVLFLTAVEVSPEGRKTLWAEAITHAMMVVNTMQQYCETQVAR
jgi:hypothetical protein